MATEPAVLNSDFRYLDKKGNLMKSRTELAVSQMLDFMGHKYEYGAKAKLGGQEFDADFVTDCGIIQVIGGPKDLDRYEAMKKAAGSSRIMAIGRPSHAAKLEELGGIVFYGRQDPKTGSIFMEDPSYHFDYTHILPLVEKCSILHGHTSKVMVELVGHMENNLLLDFGEAKKIIKGAIAAFDHKFFINSKYVKSETDTHYQIAFDGPQGSFDLTVPKATTYALHGEATVENLSTELIRLLEPVLPENVDAVGVYIYEGYNKGSHIISSLGRRQHV